MTKYNLVRSFAKKENLSYEKAQQMIDSICSIIKDNLKEGEQIKIRGFGTFLVTTREARSFKNPRTGEITTLETCKIPQFIPGKSLKEFIKDGDKNE